VSQDVKQKLAETLQDRGWRFATAESVTAGLVANAAAQGETASEWFLGGIVAWTPEVKQALLGVRPGPVVNAETAAQMARGAAEQLRADVAVATTGVGGPDEEEGQPPGTVYVGVYVDGRVTTYRLDLDGDPEQICTGAVDQALRLVLDAVG
jgi:nicotinamide-nucleotide amidase